MVADRGRGAPISPSVGAVIVSHGQQEQSVRLAHSLRVGASDVIVVETGGETPDADSPTDDVTVVRTSNLGYGSAANLGVAMLIENNEGSVPEILIISNGDCSIEPGQTILLADAIGVRQSRDAAYAVSQLAPGESRRQESKFFPDPRSHLHPILRRLRTAHRNQTATSYPGGAVIVITTAVFAELEGFDPRFFLYFEETDLYRRLVDGGHSIGDLPEVQVTHMGGTATSRHPWLTRFELGRSSALYGRKHAPNVASFVITYGIYSTVLIGRQALRLHLRRMAGACARLVGFVVGVTVPRVEPLQRSSLRAAPHADRETARRRLVASAAAADLGEG